MSNAIASMPPGFTSRPSRANMEYAMQEFLNQQNTLLVQQNDIFNRTLEYTHQLETNMEKGILG